METREERYAGSLELGRELEGHMDSGFDASIWGSHDELCVSG